jgi:methylthioribose-1-phosphate isomerase
MRTVEWHTPEAGGGTAEVWLIDQTRLPLEEAVVRCADYRAAGEAIREMRVRGAPAIGVTAAMGMALAALEAPDEPAAFGAFLDAAGAFLTRTRPTAVNLAWAVQRMRGRAAAGLAAGESPDALRSTLVAAAQQIAEEDVAACRRIGAFGAALFAAGDGVLTHCNAGALACVEYGTALAPLRTAHAAGAGLHVFVDETRPFLQGARLTAWELQQAGIDCTLITDNMAAHFMARGAVQKVIVGADRIAANGDVANKIGTYGLAILAAAHGIPFYVAAPTSTVDLDVASGAGIPIEERDPDEVTHVRGQRVAPPGVRAAHPAFDVTPARYVGAIITEAGLIRAPYAPGLRAAVAAAAGHGPAGQSAPPAATPAPR